MPVLSKEELKKVMPSQYEEAVDHAPIGEPQIETAEVIEREKTISPVCDGCKYYGNKRACITCVEYTGE
jgi:hypothetical protein